MTVHHLDCGEPHPADEFCRDQEGNTLGCQDPSCVRPWHHTGDCRPQAPQPNPNPQEQTQ